MAMVVPGVLQLPSVPDPRREVPTFLFAYANDRHDDRRFLRNLAEERRRIKQALQGAADQGLRDKDLRRARAALDQVWSASVEYPRLKAAYAAAEARAITDLAARLDRVKDSDCREYNSLLAKERASQLTRVTTEAARLAPCVPRPRQAPADLADKPKLTWPKK
jgi:hypothetical protein